MLELLSCTVFLSYGDAIHQRLNLEVHELLRHSTEERSLTAKNHPAQPEANILSPVWLLELEV